MEMRDTLKYRNIWLGCAMLWIVLYHSDLRVPTSILGYFKGMGYGGVDICLFASGIGCYFSLEKNSDNLSFLKRRFFRLTPTYWCFLAIWFISKALMGKFEISAVMGNLLGIQSLTGQGKDFNWYISALILLYLLAPILKNIVDRSSKNVHYLVVLGILLAVSLAYWETDKFIIIMTRLPIFYTGMIYAKHCRDGKKLEYKDIFLSSFMMLVGIAIYFVFRFEFEDYLWKFGLYWYPFILITPGICILISLVMEYMEKCKWLRWIEQLLNFIGNYSFEIYLVHILVFKVTTYLIETMRVIPNTNITWIISIAIVAIGCAMLRLVTQTVQNVLNIK